MWLCILIGLNFITMVLGFASRPFPQSCGSMLPEHVDSGTLVSPQTTEPPFEIQYEQGNNDEPITVILKSKQSTQFRGFMLEARERGKVDEGVPVGKFIILEPSKTALMTCNGSANSSVTQVNNQRQSLIKVNWTAQGADLDIAFRATFVQRFETFWDQVDVNVTFVESSTPQPSPATSTTESTTGTITTSTTESTTGTITTKMTTTTNNNASSQHSLTREEGCIMLMCTNCLVAILIMMVTLLDYICLAIAKWFNISSSVFCAVLEIAALVLIFVGDYYDVTLAALVCVVTVINLIELIIASLPLICDLQKGKCDIAVTVCSLLQVIFTIAIMYVGVLKLDGCGQTRMESWPLRVLITYTVWISLFVVWAIIFRKTILKKLEKWEQHEEWDICAAMVNVMVVPVVIVVGTISFTVAIMVGIATC
ncbi:ferric-chelate reductase 1 isoform X1 [Hippoglossus hippoglossus]|uniref:ferric-chelate reductase 1 isoform X1 n=1 Tax=Hippoglossus hippoglossus TaxID=8267 RepID=UPI00148B9EE2|nr:ferric-chelate reductase 1 isoform X1 [Hippoglossus hippoglossus]